MNSRRTNKQKFKLPNFELSKLRKFSLEDIINAENRELALLILTFSLIFNDLKDNIWFFNLLEPYDDLNKPDKKTAQLGQVRGMRAHCLRTIIACVREFLLVIRKKKKLIAGSDFSKVLSGLNNETRTKWQEIAELAEEKKSDNKFYKVMIKIRNSGTYHYKDFKYLFQGLQYYRKQHGIDGYVSLGENMERTRFYFGDASVQSYHKKLTDSYDSFEEKFVEYISDINETLRLIIESYLTNVLEVELDV